VIAYTCPQDIMAHFCHTAMVDTERSQTVMLLKTHQ